MVNELTVEALQASKVETQQIFIIVYRSLDTPSIMGDGCIVSQCYYYFFLFCNYISYCYILYSKIKTLDHIIMLFSTVINNIIMCSSSIVIYYLLLF